MIYDIRTSVLDKETLENIYNYDIIYYVMKAFNNSFNKVTEEKITVNRNVNLNIN